MSDTDPKRLIANFFPLRSLGFRIPFRVITAPSSRLIVTLITLKSMPASAA
jgi:hypothetical protein